MTGLRIVVTFREKGEVMFKEEKMSTSGKSFNL